MQEILTVNPKGQITIPNAVRKFYLRGNRYVELKTIPEGILLIPVDIKEKTPYTKEEWKKIEKLASQKGKTYKSPKSAKKHIDSL